MGVAGGHGEVFKQRWSRGPIARTLLELVYPPMPTLNVISDRELKAIQQGLFGPDKTVLNVGSGGLSGCGKRLWHSELPKNSKKVIHMDIGEGELVTLVGDAHNIPLEDNSVDSIIAQALIEHVEDPIKVVSEFERVLRPGGKVYVEIPFLQGVHADPSDFQRYTLDGIKVLLKRFRCVKAGVSVGPICTLIWVLRDFLSNLFQVRVLNMGVRFLVSWVLAPLRYLDHLTKNTKAAQRLANEYYFFGELPKDHSNREVAG